MFKKITILLLGLVILVGCSSNKQSAEEEMFTLTPRIEEKKAENKQVSTDETPDFVKEWDKALEEKQNNLSTIYHLVSINQNSDLSYDLIDKFANNNESIYKAFAPISGNYTIYKFIASNWGFIHYGGREKGEDPTRLFHSLIVLKTNDDNEIIDAYNYLFEWGDVPFGTRLFMATEKDIILENNFDTRKLNFKNYSVEKMGHIDSGAQASEGILDIVPYMRAEDMENELADDSMGRMREVSIRNLFEERQAKDEDTMLIYLHFASEKNNEDLIECHKTERVTRIIPKTTAVAQTALEQLFIGPTEEEMKDGLVKFNMPGGDISDYIKRIFVKNDTIYVDWVDFRNDKRPFFYNSSSGGCHVKTPLEHTLRQFPNINNVVQAFDGSPEDFYNWIQKGCESKYIECDPTPFQ